MHKHEETGFAYFLAHFFSPLVDLGIRLYMANIFFTSGWVKFQSYLDNDWNATVNLFKQMYPISYLSPEISSILITAGELGFSVLLALGLLGRFSAFGLLVLTCLLEMFIPATQIHMIWVLLLGTIFARGAGALSIDVFFKRLSYMR